MAKFLTCFGQSNLVAFMMLLLELDHTCTSSYQTELTCKKKVPIVLRKPPRRLLYVCVKDSFCMLVREVEVSK